MWHDQSDEADRAAKGGYESCQSAGNDQKPAPERGDVDSEAFGVASSEQEGIEGLDEQHREGDEGKCE